MCGICGYADFDKKPDEKILKRMLRSIIYRGPDSWGMHIDHVALGIRRLKIIDLKTGDQPIYNEDKSVVIVFNGEIYNYKPLRAQLIKKGHRFRTQSDTETLVHLYEDKGVGMLPLLNGMFAFALWDKRKKLLLLARDRFGVKPLYFAKTKNGVIFGSEVKTILAHPAYHKKINPDAVSAYATLGYVPYDESIYEGIQKLLPGEYVVISKRLFKRIQYWKSSDLVASNGERLESLLQNAVALQTQSDVPLGLLLSGGLDSSLIGFYLRQYLHKSVHSFSLGFENVAFDESRNALLAAKTIGTTHHEQIYTPKKMQSDFLEISKLLDEPFADPSLFPTYAVTRFARKKVTVALAGDGGDELFGGYPTYQGHIIAQMMSIIPQSVLNTIAAIIESLPVSDQKNYPLSQVIPILLRSVSYPSGVRQLRWMSQLGSGSNNCLRDEYKNQDAIKDLMSQLSLMKRSDIVSSIRELDSMTYLPDDLLFKSDRASMYHSLELRVPFLDNDLYNFAFSQSGVAHVSLFKTKKMLRTLADRVLPPELSQRKKKGFGIPIAQWLRGELRALSISVLKNEALYDYFDKKSIMKLWDLHQSGKIDASKKIWNMVMFSSWLTKWAS